MARSQNNSNFSSGSEEGNLRMGLRREARVAIVALQEINPGINDSNKHERNSEGTKETPLDETKLLENKMNVWVKQEETETQSKRTYRSRNECSVRKDRWVWSGGKSEQSEGFLKRVRGF